MVKSRCPFRALREEIITRNNHIPRPELTSLRVFGRDFFWAGGCRLYQYYAGFFALLAHFLRPDTRLGFSHMCLVEQHHAQAALPDAATDGLGEGTVEQAAVEVQFFTVFLSAQL